jgi:hypothetical protein
MKRKAKRETRNLKIKTKNEDACATQSWEAAVVCGRTRGQASPPTTIGRTWERALPPPSRVPRGRRGTGDRASSHDVNDSNDDADAYHGDDGDDGDDQDAGDCPDGFSSDNEDELSEPTTTCVEITSVETAWRVSGRDSYAFPARHL